MTFSPWSLVHARRHTSPRSPVLARRGDRLSFALIATALPLIAAAGCVRDIQPPRIDGSAADAIGGGQPAAEVDAAGGAGGAGGDSGSGAAGSSGAAGVGGAPADAAGAADSAAAGMTARPFGSHPHKYPVDTIRPGGEQATIDGAVRSFYDRWKAAYLVSGCGGMYIKAPGGSGATTRITNSQAHGLGMLITAWLNGHDPQARATFDGMVAVFKQFGSYLESRENRPGNANLMSYGFSEACGQIEAPDSQTDGDQPIALALLIADRLWGSTGAVDYLGQAKATLTAMKAYETNPRSKAPLLGDWCSLGNPAAPEPFQDAAHPADFAFDHFRAFFTATRDPLWRESVDSVYRIVAGFQGRHSPDTGLFPEYMLSTSGQPAPAMANFLAEPNAGAFTADTALILLRLASDYVVAGGADGRGKAALSRVNRWIREETDNDPGAIAAGYRLDGTELAPGPGPEFEAVFAAAAMVDASNQAWLDALWQRMTTQPLSGSFPDTLRLLSMILVSGNWWMP
jgi:hypothetical protein